MPLPGTGIMPASGAVYNELIAVTRRAFIPKMIVQFYNSSPTMASLLANSQRAIGGASQITVPVQGSPYVQASFVGYDGNFNAPTDQTGAQNAEFNLSLMVMPIQFLGMEGVVQQSHAVIPLLEARMNDATNTGMDTTATALFNNVSSTLGYTGLPGAIDDGTNLVTYGGLSRTTNTFWKANVYNASSAAPTRALMLQYIAGTVKNGAELPTFGVMGFGTWTKLAQDYVGQEVYNISPGSSFDMAPDGARSAFRALMVAGIPIYADPYCPEGLCYLLNSNYNALYVHEDANFEFTGFQSTIPNYQIGYIGVVLLLSQLVCVKPKANTRVYGFTYVSI